MSESGWDVWQNCAIDDYILGYSSFNSQKDLANFLNKNINSVKIKLSRRRKEIEQDKRVLSKQEYLFILSNRFTKTTEEIAKELNIPISFLSNMLDELDNLECKEHLANNYKERKMTNEEYEIFIKLHKRNISNIKISHILNRPIKFIEKLVKELEYI